jgi:prevent-host-death family protein
MKLPRLSKANEPLPTVTTTDLSRRPGEVLARVERGDRLLVCRQRRPVATLQPLDGYVFQPFTGTAHDVFGWPFGDEAAQIERLSDAQRQMLTDGYRQWRVRLVRVHGVDSDELMRSLEDLYLRGLARKTPRGIELTGRGLALREALLRAEGREDELDL